MIIDNSNLNITLSKSAKKLLQKTDAPTRTKLLKALASIPKENFLSDKRICKLKLDKGGQEKNLYHLKLEHYRINFALTDKDEIYVREICTKNQATYRRTQTCF